MALTQERPHTAPCMGVKNLPLAGISSWVYEYQRQGDPVQRVILLGSVYKIP